MSDCCRPPKALRDDVYTYILQGGSIPPAYLKYLMRREGQMQPIAESDMTLQDQLEIVACIQGERRGEAEADRRRTSGIP